MSEEEQGKAAAFLGQRGSDCPYEKWTDPWFNWMKGFLSVGGMP